MAFLLEQGANPNVGNPLIWACDNGNYAQVSLLVAFGANVNGANYPRRFGVNARHWRS